MCSGDWSTALGVEWCLLVVCLPQLAHCLHGGLKRLPACVPVSLQLLSRILCRPESVSSPGCSYRVVCFMCKGSTCGTASVISLLLPVSPGQRVTFPSFYILLSSSADMLSALAPHSSRVVGSIPCALFGFCLFRPASQYR